MSEKVFLYEELLKEVKELIDPKCGDIANMANFIAAIKNKFNFWWCGFYLINSNNELELGPFQGPTACTRIGYGKGVCGTAWKEEKAIVVPDVHQFEGHIACSSVSNSEIVLPFYKKGMIIGVLDIDSEHYNTFDENDAFFLERLLTYLDG